MRFSQRQLQQLRKQDLQAVCLELAIERERNDSVMLCNLQHHISHRACCTFVAIHLMHSKVTCVTTAALCGAPGLVYTLSLRLQAADLLHTVFR